MDPLRPRARSSVPQTHARAPIAAIPTGGMTGWQFPYLEVPVNERALNPEDGPRGPGRVRLDAAATCQVQRCRQGLYVGPLGPPMFWWQRAIVSCRKDAVPSNFVRLPFRGGDGVIRPSPSWFFSQLWQCRHT